MREREAFKLYPRGFLGAPQRERVQREQQVQETNKGFVPVQVATFKQANGINDFNHGVEELYAAYIKRCGDTSSFDFRGQVMQAAVHAFGTTSFVDWFKAQPLSPVVSELHRDFLDDTLLFIMKGRRRVSLETWASLLEATNDHGVAGLTERAQEFFGVAAFGLSRQPRNAELVEVLQAWVSQPDGMEDLLGTLHVLFGQI